jgi:putative CocE/NonD family hydrolase
MSLERRAGAVIAIMLAGLAVAGDASRRYDRPATHAHPKRRHFEAFTAMVPMRDGVKLQTLVYVPRHSNGPLPMLLTRTPYGRSVDGGTEPDPASKQVGPLIEDGYVFVYQDLRGRNGSEGTFVMNRGPGDRADPKSTDESTDAYDTIDWLVHNVPNNNGRVCVRGVSYDGWTAAEAMIDPHPALRCATEQAMWDDWFTNDDVHHDGALRLSPTFEFTDWMDATNNQSRQFPFDRQDTYDWYLALGALSNVNPRHFHGAIPSWDEVAAHPNRDEYWQKRALAPRLAGSKVPVLHVAGWWDAEDFVGPLDAYASMAPGDAAHTSHLVVGPWTHGGWWNDTGRELEGLDFGRDTSVEFRDIQRRWFAHWLRDAPLDLASATIFETGSNTWKTFETWPPRAGVGMNETRLYFRASGKLSFDAPPEGEGSDAYVSDPAKPVPYRPRPIPPIWSGGSGWDTWRASDQRFATDRPDVLTWETDALDHDVVIDGDIVAELFASTTGTDADWIVKLIDVQPDGPATEKHGNADLRGRHVMIADEVLRGRFRDSFERPSPIPAGEVVKYAIDLHPRAHVFLRGHCILVQVQSTWFPLIDRNPQTFVPSLFEAHDTDFVSATHRVFHERVRASSIVLPVVRAPP